MPFIIMSICSIIILAFIQKSSRKYLSKMYKKESNLSKLILFKRLKRNRQLFYMLLVTNLFFIISSLPYCITFVLFKGEKSENPIGQLSVHVISYTNNAFNFIFYGLSSQKYRQEFCRIFKKNKRKMYTFLGKTDQL